MAAYRLGGSPGAGAGVEPSLPSATWAPGLWSPLGPEVGSAMELLSPGVQEPGEVIREGDFPERAWFLFKRRNRLRRVLLLFLTSKPCGCRIPTKRT